MSSLSSFDAGGTTFFWIYTRAGDSVAIHVRAQTGCLQLFISGPAHQRSTCEFPDVAALLAHHAAYEAHLLMQGFSLTDYGRDRRSGPDRRAWPRRNDRERRRP